ncbi:MAG: hypothetical protein GY749_18865 [Desulfobacteraceae bacterium]|nr:hypothetical protein [Desulfobacteraceae bacterium]
MRTVFFVYPAFSFYDDGNSPNALALPQDMVLLGLNLMRDEFQKEYGPLGNYSIIGIMAHEFGHILQFNAGLHAKFPTKLLELHADYLAGWYLGNRKMVFPTDATQAMRSFYQKGDYAFNNPNHHGTPQERLISFTAGTKAIGLNYQQVFQLGLQFVTSNIHAQGSSVPDHKGQFGCSLIGNADLDFSSPNRDFKPKSLHVENIDDFLTENDSVSQSKDSKSHNTELHEINMDDYLLK